MLKRLASLKKSRALHGDNGKEDLKALQELANSRNSSQAQRHKSVNPFQRVIWEEAQDALLARGSFPWHLFDCVQTSRHSEVMVAIVQTPLATAATDGNPGVTPLLTVFAGKRMLRVLESWRLPPRFPRRSGSL